MDSEAISTPLFMGPLLLLVCVGLILFGTFCCQVYVYWYAYDEDPKFLKSYVFVVLVLECIHSALVMHMLWVYFIQDIGDPAAFAFTVWSAGASVFLEISIVSMAQTFSIYRIWQLSGKNWYITSVPIVLLILRLVFGFVTAALLCVFKTWAEFGASTHSVIVGNCSLAFAASVDVATMVLLTFYLHRCQSSFHETNRMVQRLMFYTVNTGIITAVFSVTTVLTFNFVTPSLLFAGLVAVLSKLYANVMLALLNARRYMKAQGNTHSEGGNITTSIPLAFRATDRVGNSMGGQEPLPLGGGLFKSPLEGEDTALSDDKDAKGAGMLA